MQRILDDELEPRRVRTDSLCHPTQTPEVREYGRWMFTLIVVRYQLVFATIDLLRAPPHNRSFGETWYFLYAAFFSPWTATPGFLHGTEKAVYEYVRTVEGHDLRGAWPPEAVRQLAESLVTDKLPLLQQAVVKYAGDMANPILPPPKPPSDPAGLARCALCSSTTCGLYLASSNPAWQCKKAISIPCRQCALFHAKTGPRAFTCLQAAAAKAVAGEDKAKLTGLFQQGHAAAAAARLHGYAA